MTMTPLLELKTKPEAAELVRAVIKAMDDLEYDAVVRLDDKTLGEFELLCEHWSIVANGIRRLRTENEEDRRFRAIVKLMASYTGRTTAQILDESLELHPAYPSAKANVDV